MIAQLRSISEEVKEPFEGKFWFTQLV